MWLNFSGRSLHMPRGIPAAESLREASRFLAEGNRAQALRHLDCLWRAAPQHMGAVGPIYAIQLLADGNAAAALSVLFAADKVDPRPDTEALILEALLRAGRSAEATARLTTALQRYRVSPGDPLSLAASQVPGGSDALARSTAASSIDYAVDGRVIASHGVISGWARLGWDPSAEFAVEIADEAGHKVRVGTELHVSGNSRRGFALRLNGSRLEGTQFVVSVVLPGGKTSPLPDSPLLLHPGPAPKPLRAVRAPARGTKARPRSAKSRKVDVVIPVYKGYDDTVACIESVLAEPRPAGDVVVIDDASPEPRLPAWLDRQARRGRITLLRNASNAGFSASVNRALALHPDRDALVLNSDTVVHGNWLHRLRAVAYSACNIGSVTPFTNDGSVASYPRFKATEMTPDAAAALDRLAARLNRGKVVELPVGVGFCLYLRRDCLDATGELDTRVFGAGYGEEVDLCMRARAKGWRHVLAADTFVLHKAGGSFGTRQAALLERGQRLLDLRYPRFQRMVDAYLARDPARGVRRALAEGRLREQKQRRALLVTLALTGGVERFVDERAETLESEGLRPLLLRPSRDGSEVILTGAGLDAEELCFKQPSELPRLAALLRTLPLAHVELHHFMGLAPQLIEAILKLRVPYDAYVHDYVWLCPQITLIDRTGRYCGEPHVRICERCVKQTPPNLPEKIRVAALRKRSARWLAGARRVIAPSADVVRRLTHHFPGLHAGIRPWQREPAQAPRFNPLGERVRVALLGAIGQHKGYDVLLQCARDAVRRELPLEFSLIGYSENDARLLATRRVFISGAYRDGEVSHLLRRENPHVILLPSVWPETWSYTLTHALETGLPTVAFDLGTIAERMRGLRRGLLLPLATRASEINDHLIRMATSPAS